MLFHPNRTDCGKNDATKHYHESIRPCTARITHLPNTLICLFYLLTLLTYPTDLPWISRNIIQYTWLATWRSSWRHRLLVQLTRTAKHPSHQLGSQLPPPYNHPMNQKLTTKLPTHTQQPTQNLNERTMG